jgi:hypothetical protein|tara:strand:- start:4857 stop:5105 length:249 start_codon:yes stop_codon:yes gene_type:complete
MVIAASRHAFAMRLVKLISLASLHDDLRPVRQGLVRSIFALQSWNASSIRSRTKGSLDTLGGRWELNSEGSELNHMSKRNPS